MISKNNSIIKPKNSDIKLSENDINIPNRESSSNKNYLLYIIIFKLSLYENTYKIM